MRIKLQRSWSTILSKLRFLKRHKRKLVVLAISIFFMALLTFVIDLNVNDIGKFTVYNSITAVPSKPVAIIFGAAVNGNTPRFELEKRLDSGVELYQQGKVPKLLMSGGADEVKIMQLYAAKRGVPAGAIIQDEAGLRTYASCYRALHTYNFTQAIVVNQPEYMARTLYLCNSIGLDSVGLQATTKTYSKWDNTTRFVREYVASQRAWIEVNLIHPTA